MTARSAASKSRLSQQMGVSKVLADRRWHTLRDFRSVKGMDTSISARIREMRDEQGRRLVVCKRFEDGVYRYRRVR